MPMVILTADVQDGAAWERAYRTHGDLFRAAGFNEFHYTVGDDGHVVMCTNTDDVDAYMAFISSKATQDAMKNDGVKRETVKVFVLDKQLSV
jgi:heme-degrading monooxygenase HmoA